MHVRHHASVTYCMNYCEKQCLNKAASAGSIPDSFGTARNLQIIDVKQNQLTGLPSAWTNSSYNASASSWVRIRASLNQISVSLLWNVYLPHHVLARPLTVARNHICLVSSKIVWRPSLGFTKGLLSFNLLFIINCNFLNLWAMCSTFVPRSTGVIHTGLENNRTYEQAAVCRLSCVACIFSFDICTYGWEGLWVQI